MIKKAKKFYKCEICGELQQFTLNCCENCFNKEWERGNKRERKDGTRNGKGKIYNKIKKN